MRTVYLDHTASTPVRPEVREAMQPYFSGRFGNPSSVHAFGREARNALEGARSTIARAIGAEPGELFFTSGGTESDNLALRGSAASGRERGRGRLITTRAEHHAVLDTAEALAEEGYELRLLPVNQTGAVEMEALLEALSPSTALLSVMHANNEVGTLSPVAEAAAHAHRHGALVHTDAVQTLGKIPVSVRELGVDLMTISAHKLYGPKGIGALYIRRGTEITPLLHGGGQERGKRPGTENVACAVGFARAVEIALHEMREESQRLRGLRDTLEQRLCATFPEVLINGDRERRLPHILNVSFDSGRIRLEGEMLLMNMDLCGIAVSSGSACTSGSIQPSHVLLAMGRDAETAKATLRFSFGKSNTGEDVDYVVVCLGEVLNRMRRTA